MKTHEVVSFMKERSSEGWIHTEYLRGNKLFEEDLEATRQALHTQQVISVGRHIDLVNDVLIGSLGFLRALLSGYQLII